jgi:predicted dehydrogenase
VIADDHVDAVIIATPHTQHVSWAIAALKAGKHVLIQKPLCDNLAEADALVAAAEAHPRQIALALPHFAPYLYAFRERIEAGRIGKVTGGRARASHGGPDVYYREIARIFGEPETAELWFFDPKQASVGALFDMGVYAVAQLIALLGSVKRVTAVTASVDKPTTLEDTATVIMQMHSGALATAETSWCDPARTWEMNIHGSAGKLVMRERGEEAFEYVPQSFDSDHAEIERRALDPGQGVGNLHEHFLDCVERGEQPSLSNVYAARHVTEVLLAGLESGRTGKPVDVRTRVSAIR